MCKSEKSIRVLAVMSGRQLDINLEFRNEELAGDTNLWIVSLVMILKALLLGENPKK